MIAKFDGVPGTNFSSLLAFIHSQENREHISYVGCDVQIVQVKEVVVGNQPGETLYNLTLQIEEWVRKGRPEEGLRQVDPKYLLRVYEIIGKDRQPECV